MHYHQKMLLNWIKRVDVTQQVLNVQEIFEIKMHILALIENEMSAFLLKLQHGCCCCCCCSCHKIQKNIIS